MSDVVRFRVITCSKELFLDLQVIDVKESMSDEMLTLEAGLAVLEVTPSHRISVPNPSFTGSSQEPPVLPNWKKASELNKGDSVMCEDGEAKELKVGKTQLEEAAPVYNIRFKPDVPVVVFAQPSSILSRGAYAKFVSCIRFFQMEGAKIFATLRS